MLGFIGAGNMGGAILRGVLRAGLHAPEDIVFSAGTPEEAGAVAEATGARAVAANVDVVREAGPGSVVVLAVKPHVVPAVLAEIAQAAAEEGTVLVSVAAGTSLEKLGAPLASAQPIVRTMPNVAASVGQSMTAICPNGNVSEEDVARVEEIFGALGRTVRLDEKDFSAYSAIAGCSPAFTFTYIDALARGAVQAGISKADAVEIAAQAVRGAAEMLLGGLENGATPAGLADAVQSPGGTTVAGVVAMEDAGFSASVVRAVQAAIARDKELGA